jgi:hypothetical protein
MARAFFLVFADDDQAPPLDAIDAALDLEGERATRSVPPPWPR